MNSIYRVRPICSKDFDALMRISKESGAGFTSLPNNATYLASKIDASEAAFTQQIKKPENEHYLFVLEEIQTQSIVGTCGIKAMAGFSTPLYHFRLQSDIHVSPSLKIENNREVMHLSTDYSHYSEVGSLYIHPNARQRFLGRLLAQCRYLFMQQFDSRFTSTLIAQMRGFNDENNQSPFWGWMQSNFLNLPFDKADYLCGIGDKHFIQELSPRYPIYVSTLPKAARESIGSVHPQTIPAMKMLKKEGFCYRGYVDILDGGPSMQASIDSLVSVRKSKVLPCKITEKQITAPPTHNITNTHCSNFRATLGHIDINLDSATATISEQTAKLLDINNGDNIRFSPLT